MTRRAINAFGLTPEEEQEFSYRREERLALLCGAGTATTEQEGLAAEEAYAAIARLRSEG